MKYFTPELYLGINSRNRKTAAAAMAKWDAAVSAYWQRLDAQKLPRKIRRLADLNLHDWRIKRLSGSTDFQTLLLGHEHAETEVTYLSGQSFFYVGPKRWPFSTESVEWLYDEVAPKGNHWMHRILFSDGSEVVIEFDDVVIRQKGIRALQRRQ